MWLIRLLRYTQCVLCTLMHSAGVAKDRAVQAKGNWNVFSKRMYKWLSVWFPGWWLIANCEIRTYRTNNRDSRLFYHEVDPPLVWAGFWWYELESRDSGSVKISKSLIFLSVLNSGGCKAALRGHWTHGLRFSGTLWGLLSDMMVKIKIWPVHMITQLMPMLKLILLIYLYLLLLESLSWPPHTFWVQRIWSDCKPCTQIPAVWSAEFGGAVCRVNVSSLYLS